MFQFLIDEDQDPADTTGVTTTDPLDQTVSPDGYGFLIGDKIKVDRHIGTVKYVGEVSPHVGTWLGIEWDDVTRGKHCGTVEGVEYFRSGELNAASFIRPPKATKLKDIFEALEQRYGRDEKFMSNLKLLDEKIPPRHVRYDELEILDLANQNIVDLGKPGELVKTCPYVEFLNLAENFIQNWEVLQEVCDSFEHLKTLDMSSNPLHPYQPIGSVSCRGFPSLEHIVLGNVNYSWDNMLSTSVLWPSVTNLQVPFNAISKLTPPTVSLLNLTNLDLEANQILDWDEVIKLNVCQHLEYLNLCQNQLRMVRFPLNHADPKNCQTTRYFLNLKRLNLGQNFIEDWTSITELNKLQTLVELRMEVNPVFDKDTKENNRQMVIARIAKLVKLEGVEINRQERRDAEIDYMKKFSEKWRGEGTELRFAAEHPRYVELVKRFGEFDEAESSKGTTKKSLQSTLISIDFIPEGLIKAKPCSRSVMPNMTVQKLKMLVQRIFKVSTPVAYLGVISSQNSQINFPLDNDHFDLSQYSIEDGDKIVARW